jgi:hypothetical protein
MISKLHTLFFVLIFLISFNSYAQTEDSITIAKSELTEVFAAIDELVYQDSIKTILISDMSMQLKNYEFVHFQDSMLISYRISQINILNEQVNIYSKELKDVDRWYKKPWVGFVGGCVSITLSSWILKNILL